MLGLVFKSVAFSVSKALLMQMPQTNCKKNRINSTVRCVQKYRAERLTPLRHIV
jgi:hypothetical protein